AVDVEITDDDVPVSLSATVSEAPLPGPLQASSRLTTRICVRIRRWSRRLGGNATASFRACAPRAGRGPLFDAEYPAQVLGGRQRHPVAVQRQRPELIVEPARQRRPLVGDLDHLAAGHAR